MKKNRKTNYSVFIFVFIIYFAVFSDIIIAQQFPETQIETATVKQTQDPNNPFIIDGKLDIEAVVKHFEDMYRSDSSISEFQLKITRPRNQRTLQMKSWTKGQEQVLIVIQSPPREKGIATLKVGNNLWNYLPNIDRTIRIPPSMMLQSWMGSDFTNDDLVRESSFSQDYTYELVGRSEDPNGWKINFVAKPDIVGLWNRFELIVSEDASYPIHAKYFDRKDQHARSIIWEDIKDFDGHIIPSKMTLIPEDEPENKTELIYIDIDFDADVPESTFSLSELERSR